MNVNDVVTCIVARAPRAVLVSSLGTATSAVRLVTGDGPHLYFGAAMGSALAGALGLAEAVPQREIIAVLGDGDFLMGSNSLWSTAFLHPPNLTVVVLADGRYTITGGQPLGGALQLAAVAEAMSGLRGVVARSADDLALALETRREGKGTLVIEAELDERLWPGPSPFVDPTETVRAVRSNLAEGRQEHLA